MQRQAEVVVGADRRGRLVPRPVDREHAVEAGDLEDLRDVPVAAGERELALVDRRRFTPPTSTPRVVESMNVVFVKSTITFLPPFEITSSSCCLNSGAVSRWTSPASEMTYGVVAQLLRVDVEVHRSPCD